MIKLFKRFKHRHNSKDDLIDLNEMLLKFGRRVTHDLQHAIVHMDNDSSLKPLFYERVEHWKSIFYFDKGPKDYHSEIHKVINGLEMENDRLKRLCEKNGINPDPTPF